LVPSPRPREIVELDAIRACLHAGHVIIAAGGGGIPVVRVGHRLKGVEAVIDKDRVSALLARSLAAEVLLFSTGVDRVAWHFNRPDARFLDQLSFDQARKYLAEGEFPPGSMGPKIEAALEFLEAGGRFAIVTSPELLAAALRGRAGTQILPPPRVALPGAAVA
jgi:carbamate kinase